MYGTDRSPVNYVDCRVYFYQHLYDPNNAHTSIIQASVELCSCNYACYICTCVIIYL